MDFDRYWMTISEKVGVRTQPTFLEQRSVSVEKYSAEWEVTKTKSTDESSAAMASLHRPDNPDCFRFHAG